MRILVAVITCAKDQYRARAQAQRETWAKDAPPGVDVVFFVGKHTGAWREDEVVLSDVGDDYAALPAKVRAVMAYAKEHGYDWLVKTDDDVYIQLDRLVDAIPTGDVHYSGRVRLPSRGHPAPYCSGFCYWLDRIAMSAFLDVPPFKDIHEDVCTGNILLKAGIQPKDDPRYNIVMSKRCARTGKEGPRQGNDVIAACEFEPAGMRVVHDEWTSVRSGNGFNKVPMNTEFDKVDVLLKTFLRDGLMMRCVQGIERTMPGARIIVVDDGYHSREKRTFYSEMQLRGHVIKMCPFDTGYGAKMNIGQALATRPYVLRIADDFEFDDHAAKGVLSLIETLDGDHGILIASGRVNNQPYECTVEISGEPGNLDVKLTRVDVSKTKGPHTFCDMTVNYSLIRRDFLQSFKWDERYKIGGDHYDLYGHAMTKGPTTVAYVHGVNVNTLTTHAGDAHRTYDYYRGRARLSLPWTFERHGWARIILMDGTVDTRESVQQWADEYRDEPPSIDPYHVASNTDMVMAARARRRAIRKAREGLPKPRSSAEMRTQRIAEPQQDIKHTPLATVGAYGIRSDYRHRKEVPHYDDTTTEGDWQREVYERAVSLFYQHDCSSVLDLGCGNADKLLRHFSDAPSMTGAEVEPTLTWLKATYPEYSWVLSGTTQGQYDMVICSDVIEHVVDPNEMVAEILRHGPRVIVLSTPARELLHAPQEGPPKNLHHVREWTSEEFASYLAQELPDIYRIEEHFISNEQQATQLVVIVRT